MLDNFLNKLSKAIMLSENDKVIFEQHVILKRLENGNIFYRK